MSATHYLGLIYICIGSEICKAANIFSEKSSKREEEMWENIVTTSLWFEMLCKVTEETNCGRVVDMVLPASAYRPPPCPSAGGEYRRLEVVRWSRGGNNNTLLFYKGCYWVGLCNADPKTQAPRPGLIALPDAAGGGPVSGRNTQHPQDYPKVEDGKRPGAVGYLVYELGFVQWYPDKMAKFTRLYIATLIIGKLKCSHFLIHKCKFISLILLLLTIFTLTPPSLSVQLGCMLLCRLSFMLWRDLLGASSRTFMNHIPLYSLLFAELFHNSCKYCT